MIKLWDNQVEAIAAIKSQFRAGNRKTLAVLATGSGKTIIYLSLVDEWVKHGARVLILAHRRELIHQPIERAEEYFPKLAKVMGVVMASQDDCNAQVVVATVQTVSRDKGRLEAVGAFDYVVLDECHHGTAKSYMKLVEHFPDAKWLGMTATPFRTDGDSLAKVFDSVAYRYPITAAIERGTLVPFDAYGFSLPVDLGDIIETEYGWEDQSLGDLLSATNVLEIVYSKWEEFCSDRKTICFTASVEQAYATAKHFRGMGVSAQAVSGKTAKRERDRILKQFRDGSLQVVMNCQVWTEGVDVPEASAAMMVCPTRSDLAYVQKLGRVLRTFPDKKDAIVLDFAPAEDRNIVMAGDILGMPRLVEKEKEKAIRGGMVVRMTRVDDHGLAVSVDPAHIVVEALKYLRKGSLAWTLQDYLVVSTVSESVMLAVELPNVERLAKAEEMKKNGWDDRKERLYKSLKSHRLWVCKKAGRSWEALFSGHFEELQDATKAGEKATQLDYSGHLAKKRGAWRKRPVSDPQLKYMARLGIQIPEGCTSGQAAQLISYELASRAIVKSLPHVEIKIMKGEIA